MKASKLVAVFFTPTPNEISDIIFTNQDDQFYQEQYFEDMLEEFEGDEDNIDPYDYKFESIQLFEQQKYLQYKDNNQLQDKLLWYKQLLQDTEKHILEIQEEIKNRKVNK